MKIGIKQYKPQLSLGVKSYKPIQSLGVKHYNFKQDSTNLLSPKSYDDIYDHHSNSTLVQRMPMLYTHFGSSKPTHEHKGNSRIEKRKPHEKKERFT